MQFKDNTTGDFDSNLVLFLKNKVIENISTLNALKLLALFVPTYYSEAVALLGLCYLQLALQGII